MLGGKLIENASASNSLSQKVSFPSLECSLVHFHYVVSIAASLMKTDAGFEPQRGLSRQFGDERGPAITGLDQNTARSG